MSDNEFPPLRIGEIVLRTGRYETMKHWYCTVLRVDPYFERNVAAARMRCEASHDGPRAEAPRGLAWAAEVRLCFFRLILDHPYQQVVAIFETPGATQPAANTAGLHHLQLRDPSREVLARRYRALSAVGIEPFRAMDHGPNSSLYYRDPDDNIVEIAVPNYSSVERYLQALASDEFKANPSGHRLDLAQLTPKE